MHNISVHYLSDSFDKYDDNNNAENQVDGAVEDGKDCNNSRLSRVGDNDSTSSGSCTSREDSEDSSSEEKEEFSNDHSSSE